MEKFPLFGFLEEFVLEVLKKNGFEDLTDEQTLAYVPQFTSLLQDRLGTVLVEQLNETQLETFAELVHTDGVTPEQWYTFWKESVPTFEEDVVRVSKEFIKDVEEIRAKQI